MLAERPVTRALIEGIIMEVILTEDFSYSEDGIKVVTAKEGDKLSGDPAKWAMNQNKAKRTTSKKKDTNQNKAK